MVLVIVRHSERLDEVNQYDFARYVSERLNHPSFRRDENSLWNDPPITLNGMDIAKKAGHTLNHHFIPRIHNTLHGDDSHNKPIKFRLYASKLLRCIQTSIEIAKQLNINEIYFSSGLAMTAAAVERMGCEDFDFISENEMKSLAPDINFIDCDVRDKSYSISNHDWYGALQDVSHQVDVDIKIVVAHRETIRNLIPIHPRLPYCSIALCHYPRKHHDHPHPEHKEHSKEFSLNVSHVFDNHGNHLHEFGHHHHFIKRKGKVHYVNNSQLQSQTEQN
jgi:broad specificity phosphatase PhoE